MFGRRAAEDASAKDASAAVALPLAAEVAARVVQDALELFDTESQAVEMDAGAHDLNAIQIHHDDNRELQGEKSTKIDAPTPMNLSLIHISEPTRPY